MGINISFLKRLVKEDFEAKYQDLVGQIAFILNPALEQITAILSNGLALSDLNVQVKQITLRVNSDGVPTTDASFQSSLKGRCSVIMIGRALNLTNPTTYPTGGHSVSFTLNNEQIIIKHITGLTPNDQWQITVIACV